MRSVTAMAVALTTLATVTGCDDDVLREVGTTTLVELAGDTAEEATVRFAASATWTSCGSDCGEDGAGPLEGLRIRAGAAGTPLLTLAEIEPGRYRAEAGGFATAYDYEVDGRAFTFAAPPWFTAAVTPSASDPPGAQVSWSPSVAHDPLGVGERILVQVLDPAGEPTSYDCLVGPGFAFEEGDGGEIPPCAFPTAGRYTVIVDRTHSERPDKDFGQPLHYGGASTTLERRLTLDVP